MFEKAENRNVALTAWLEQERRHGKNARGIIIRRSYRHLEEVEKQCDALFPETGATFSKSDATWKFASGATFKIRHICCQEEAWMYAGQSFTCVIFDDPREWVPDDYVPRYMLGTLRSAHGVSTTAIMVSSS